MIWLLTALLSTASAKGLLTKVGACKAAAKEAPMVMVVKQWHLPPKTVTKGFKEKYPQEKNQSAIYLALADKIKNKKLDIVVSEGCEGEINGEFTGVFNGWDIESLRGQSQRKGYDRILTLIPMKLEARYGAKVQTVCGDNEKLVQEGNVRVSNMRGWAGFYTRLTEPSTDEEKKKLFTEAAAELLKMSKDTPAEELLPKIKEKLGAELELFNKSLTDRNDFMVKALEGKTFKTAAIVIGGLHVDDLKTKLETAGFNCELFEPTGYAREEEDLIKDFQKALKN